MSLRDVERCMIVFEYFFERKDLFGPRMDEKATAEKKVVIMPFPRTAFPYYIILIFISAIG